MPVVLLGGNALLVVVGVIDAPPRTAEVVELPPFDPVVDEPPFGPTKIAAAASVQRASLQLIIGSVPRAQSSAGKKTSRLGCFGNETANHGGYGAPPWPYHRRAMFLMRMW